MNSLLDEQEEPSRDRELTLSTGAILALFFGLVVLCGLCFGLGYSVRGPHTPPPPVAATEATEPPAATTPDSFKSFKPAAGSPVGSNASPQPAKPSPLAPVAASSQPAAAPTARSAGEPAHTPEPLRNPPPGPASTAFTPASPPSFVVQIAAITLNHKDDADILVSALRAKGYAANAFPEPDRYIHVQVGPFSSRQTADAMRARLAGDGYQPFLKQQ